MVIQDLRCILECTLELCDAGSGRIHGHHSQRHSSEEHLIDVSVRLVGEIDQYAHSASYTPTRDHMFSTAQHAHFEKTQCQLAALVV